MFYRRVWFLLSAVLALGFSHAPAAVITLAPVADTDLFEISPTNNLGGQTFMPVGFTGASTRGRGLLRFDLSQIPATATVTSVTLRVEVTFGNGLAITCDLHQMLVPWIEGNKSGGPDMTGNLGAPATVGEPTWNHRVHPNVNWGAPGALAGTDYLGNSSGSITVQNSTAYTFSSANLLSNVQAWVSNPATNYGWLLKDRNESASATARHFASREDAPNAPVLTVGYTAPPTVTLTNTAVANNQFRFSFLAVSNLSHTVESTASLDPAGWVTVTNFMATNVTLTRAVTNPLTANNRFFRVKIP